jgi:hypothetical protein
VCCLVFLDDGSGKATVVGYGEAVLFGPGAYFAAAFPAGCGPGAAAGPLRARRPGALHERSKLPAEVTGVSRTQVDFVALAVHGERHGLVGRAPGQVVFKLYLDALHYLSPALRATAVAE